jgi:4-amino-4-deoxy-L-arabinose transferase-like glycosyltransferase
MSIDDFEAMKGGGVIRFFSTINSQPTQAPLVPMLSSLAYSLLGRPVLMAAFCVQLAAYAIVVLTTYGIASVMGNRWASLVAALAAASLPIMVIYTHDYSFAIPATAATNVAIWAAIRSDSMRSRIFSVVWGLSLGAMLVARTMTLAFLPAFATLAVLHVALSRPRRRSLIGVLSGIGAAALVAGPWYFAEGRSVWQYLTSFGYGSASSQYGAARPLSSVSALVGSALGNVNQYIWLPLALVLCAGLVALVTLFAVRLVRRRLPPLGAVVASPWFYLAALTGEGLLALGSSRNAGSGFIAPILPAMIVLAVMALAKATESRRVWGCVALTCVAALCLPSLIASSVLNTASGQPISVHLPTLGWLTVVDARGTYLSYAQQEDELTPTDPRGTLWRQANENLLAALKGVEGASEQVPVVFAFDHSLVNVNTLGWEELVHHGLSPVIYQLVPSAATSGYRAQLIAMVPREGVVLLSSDPRGMFPPILAQASVAAALRGLRFRRLASVPLPDGSSVDAWYRCDSIRASSLRPMIDG